MSETITDIGVSRVRKYFDFSKQALFISTISFQVSISERTLTKEIRSVECSNLLNEFHNVKSLTLSKKKSDWFVGKLMFTGF